MIEQEKKIEETEKEEAVFEFRPVGAGLQVIAACLPIALGGLLSAIAQGKVAAASMNILAKNPDDFAKGMIFCTIVELYAIISMLASIILLGNI